MAIDPKLIDKLLADYKKREDIIGEHGLLKQITKAVLERAMQAEMTEHRGYEKHDQAGHHSGNSRNGKTTKALKGDFGEVPLETRRDRNGTCEPKIVAKGQTRFTGFDDKIVSMYAPGMSTREISGYLEEICSVEGSLPLGCDLSDRLRWSCSITLLRYLHWRNVTRPGIAPSPLGRPSQLDKLGRCLR